MKLTAAVMAPTMIPSSALGRDGAVPPSVRIVLGGIGIVQQPLTSLADDVAATKRVLA